MPDAQTISNPLAPGMFGSMQHEEDEEETEDEDQPQHHGTEDICKTWGQVDGVHHSGDRDTHEVHTDE